MGIEELVKSLRWMPLESTNIKIARERLAAANVDSRRLYEALEPVVGSHCPDLAGTPYHVHRYGARLE